MDQRAIDFDAMTFEALRLLRTENVVVDLLVARYPWLAVNGIRILGAPFTTSCSRFAKAAPRYSPSAIPISVFTVSQGPIPDTSVISHPTPTFIAFGCGLTTALGGG